MFVLRTGILLVGVLSIVLVVELMDCLIVYLQGCPEPDSMVPEPVAPEIMVTEPEIQIEEVEVSNEIESEPVSGVIDEVVQEEKQGPIFPFGFTCLWVLHIVISDLFK